jgi:hypothetical protein
VQNSGEILPDNPVTQVFRSDNNYLCAVGVLVGTYGKARKSSNLLLEVYTIDGNARRLGHAQVNLAEVYDNSYVEVFLKRSQTRRANIICCASVRTIPRPAMLPQYM